MNIHETLLEMNNYQTERNPYLYETLKTIRAIINNCELIPPNSEGWVLSFKTQTIVYEDDNRNIEEYEYHYYVYLLTEIGNIIYNHYIVIDKIYNDMYYEEKVLPIYSDKLFDIRIPGSSLEYVMEEFDFRFDLRKDGNENDMKIYKHSDSRMAFSGLCDGNVYRVNKQKGEGLYNYLQEILLSPNSKNISNQQKKFSELKSRIDVIEKNQIRREKDEKERKIQVEVSKQEEKQIEEQRKQEKKSFKTDVLCLSG